MDEFFKVFETTQARADRRFRQMWITILVLIALLVVSNMGWLVYESQYQDVVTTTQTVSQNANGGSNSNYFYGGEDGETDDNNNSN